MKNFFGALIFFLLLIFFIEVAKNKNKRHNTVYIDQSQLDTDTVVNDYVPVENLQTNIEKQTQKVNIVALGDVDYQTLQNASQIISDFWGYDTNISDEKQEITSDIISHDDVLDAWKCVTILPKTEDITVYITLNPLYQDDTKLRGFTTLYGKSVIARGNMNFLKETLIHEIGHTKGLDHCSDSTCVMAINNDEWDSNNFCSVCRSKIVN
jgi:hypothetical protein